MIEYVICYAFAVNKPFRSVVMIQKKRPETLNGFLNLPGGKINPGETPLQAGLRELREETGLEEVQEIDPMVYYPSKVVGKIEAGEHRIFCVKIPVVYQNLIQEKPPAGLEAEVVSWFQIPDVYNETNLMPNLRLIMPLCESGANDWVIIDQKPISRYAKDHDIRFQPTSNSDPVEVKLKGMGYFIGEKK